MPRIHPSEAFGATGAAMGAPPRIPRKTPKRSLSDLEPATRAIVSVLRDPERGPPLIASIAKDSGRDDATAILVDAWTWVELAQYDVLVAAAHDAAISSTPLDYKAEAERLVRTQKKIGVDGTIDLPMEWPKFESDVEALKNDVEGVAYIEQYAISYNPGNAAMLVMLAAPALRYAQYVKLAAALRSPLIGWAAGREKYREFETIMMMQFPMPYVDLSRRTIKSLVVDEDRRSIVHLIFRNRTIRSLDLSSTSISVKKLEMIYGLLESSTVVTTLNILDMTPEPSYKSAGFGIRHTTVMLSNNGSIKHLTMGFDHLNYRKTAVLDDILAVRRAISNITLDTLVLVFKARSNVLDGAHSIFARLARHPGVKHIVLEGMADAPFDLRRLAQDLSEETGKITFSED